MLEGDMVISIPTEIPVIILLLSATITLIGLFTVGILSGYEWTVVVLFVLTIVVTIYMIVNDNEVSLEIE